MSAMTQRGEPDESEICLRLHETRTTLDMTGVQADITERTRPRRGTDETIDSASTFMGSQKGHKEIEIQTLELRPSASDSLTLHPSSATVDEEGQPTRDQAAFGRWKRFRLRWLTAYRVLIMFITIANSAAMITKLLTGSAAEAPLTATAANIMAAVLLRQEDLINFSFGFISRLPSTLPFSVRRMIGDFHHYGGVHVGCALSALLWYIMFTGLNTIRILDLLSLDHMTPTLRIQIVLSYTTLLAIFVICLTAIPRFRVRFHNTFEATHRFGGWTALLVLWLHAGIATLTPDTSAPLYTHPSLWLLTCTTILITIPWLRMHRVPITSHRLSNRELHLTFPFTNMPHTSTLRFSTSLLTEWHAFATIPSADGGSILVSAAGDWTMKLLANPPTTLWIRNPPVQNFLACVPLFRDVLLVATGAGIAPVLSLLTNAHIAAMKAQNRRVRIIWCVSDPWVVHWVFVLDAMRAIDKHAVVFDSRVRRPDLAFEARRLCERENLEAVFVVSNARVTGELVEECKARGLASYGAVFDS